MKLEDYDKYRQNGGSYIIPVSIFEELYNDMENYKEENKILKDIAYVLIKIMTRNNE